MLSSKSSVRVAEHEVFCSLYFLTLAPIVSFLFNCLNFSLPDLKLHANTLGFRWLSQTAATITVLPTCPDNLYGVTDPYHHKQTHWLRSQCPERRLSLTLPTVQPGREDLVCQHGVSAACSNILFIGVHSPGLPLSSTDFICLLGFISANIKEYLWNMPSEFHPQHF